MKKKIVLMVLIAFIGFSSYVQAGWRREGSCWKKVTTAVKCVSDDQLTTLQRSKEEQPKLDMQLVHEIYEYMWGTRDNFFVARGLIEQGADVNFSYHGSPLLVTAAKWPNFAAVKFLLEHGACVDIRDCLNETAVDQAARQGSIEILELLFVHGARCPQHILSYAVWSGNPNVIEFLLKCEKEPCIPCLSRECGAISLYQPVCFGRTDVVALILRYGLGNVHEFLCTGNAPLHEARSEKMWALLVQAGADPMQKNKVGKTAQEMWDSRAKERAAGTCCLQ